MNACADDGEHADSVRLAVPVLVAGVGRYSRLAPLVLVVSIPDRFTDWPRTAHGPNAICWLVSGEVTRSDGSRGGQIRRKTPVSCVM